MHHLGFTFKGCFGHNYKKNFIEYFEEFFTVFTKYKNLDHFSSLFDFNREDLKIKFKPELEFCSHLFYQILCGLNDSDLNQHHLLRYQNYLFHDHNLNGEISFHLHFLHKHNTSG